MRITLVYFTISLASLVHGQFDPTTHPNWQLVNDKSCGLQPAMKIFGGQNASLGEFPWMALVLTTSTELATGAVDTSFCGGSIISHRYVLTAAHCFTSVTHKHSNGRIIVGEYDLRTDPDCDKNNVCAPKVIIHPASEVILHPDYVPYPVVYVQQADIALVRVDPEFTFNDFVSPICLEYGDLLSQTYGGETAVTIGFGGTKLLANGDPEYPNILQKVSLEVLDEPSCTDLILDLVTWKSQIPKSQMCAGTQTQFSYKGDSGSPMFIAKTVDNDIPRQYQIGVGVVSYPNNETIWRGGKRPNGYTKVAYFLEWILDQMKD